MCVNLGLNPKGRSAVVRMRVSDHLRQRIRAPSWQPAREHQAALLTRLGHPDLAERVWQSTLRLDAPAPWVGLGHAQLAGGFLAEAAKSFARSAQMGDPAAELHRAEALAAGGDVEGAARGCDAHLAAHPADLRALAMRADFLVRGGFVDEAVKVLRSAVELHPEIPGLARTLGILLLKSKRPAEAEEMLREAARRDPKDVDASANFGAALLVGGKTREALEILRKTLRLDPKRADVLNNLGVAYLAMGRTRSALANLKKAAKQVEAPRILLNLGKVFEDSEEPSEAVLAYEQVLRLRRDDSEALAGRKRATRADRSNPSPPKEAATRTKKTGRSSRRRPSSADAAPPA